MDPGIDVACERAARDPVCVREPPSWTLNLMWRVREPFMDPELDMCVREPIIDPGIDVCVREPIMDPELDVCVREPSCWTQSLMFV